MEREALAAAFQVFTMMRGKINDVRVRADRESRLCKATGDNGNKCNPSSRADEMKRLIENPPDKQRSFGPVTSSSP
ncbi:MAG: hypothetical protein U0X92_04035 [Anaerolineales bacterium]